VKKFIRKNQPLPKLMKNEGMPPLPDVPHINPSQMPKGLEAGVAWLCDQFAKQQVGIPLTGFSMMAFRGLLLTKIQEHTKRNKDGSSTKLRSKNR